MLTNFKRIYIKIILNIQQRLSLYIRDKQLLSKVPLPNFAFKRGQGSKRGSEQVNGYNIPIRSFQKGEIQVQIGCPGCSRVVSKKADICPHCGYSIKNWRRKDLIRLLSCLVAIMTVLLVLCLGLFGEPINKPLPVSKNERDDIDAFVMSQSFVEQRLIAPATAKFPYIGDAYEVTKLDSVTWLVDSYVDSQNGFGAFIRTRYVAKLMYMGNGQWKLMNIKVYK